MIKINKAFISEIKRRLPKNIKPPLTLDFLLRQKSIDKIDYNESNSEKNIVSSQKIIENFLKNNSAKPFSSLMKRANMKNSVIDYNKKLVDISHKISKYNTPFQI